VQKDKSVTGDNNQLAFCIVPRHCAASPNQTNVTGDNNWLAFAFHPRTLNALNQAYCLTAKTRAVLRSITPLKKWSSRKEILPTGFSRLSTVY